jgi:pseudouridine-5'-phosphate glycosidase
MQTDHRRMSTVTNQDASGLRKIIRVSSEVADAIATNKPVVALESTIYTHGALGNDLALEDVVRQHGAIPAVIGILDGVPTVGMTPEEVLRMVESGTARKVSRRDVAYLVGMVSLSLIFSSAVFCFNCMSWDGVCTSVPSFLFCSTSPTQPGLMHQ